MNLNFQYPLFFIILFLSFSTSIHAQNIYIPDGNFKNALTNKYLVVEEGDFEPRAKVDANNDGEIQISEAEAVKWLKINDSDIASLKGIQYFTNLKKLYIQGNHIADLDLSKNIKLEKLNIENSQ